MSSTLDSDAEELKKRAEVEKAKTAGTGRRANQSGLGILKKFSKYKEVTAKYRTTSSPPSSEVVDVPNAVASPEIKNETPRGTVVEQSSDKRRTNVGQESSFDSEKVQLKEKIEIRQNVGQTSDKRRTNAEQTKIKKRANVGQTSDKNPMINGDEHKGSFAETSDKRRTNVGQDSDREDDFGQGTYQTNVGQTSDEHRTNVGQENIKTEPRSAIEWIQGDIPIENVGRTSDEHRTNVGQKETFPENFSEDVTSDKRRTNVGQDSDREDDFRQRTYQINIGQASDKHLPNVGQDEGSIAHLETSDERRTNIGQSDEVQFKSHSDTYQTNIGQTSDEHLPNVGQDEGSTAHLETSDERRTNIGQGPDSDPFSFHLQPEDNLTRSFDPFLEKPQANSDVLNLQTTECEETEANGTTGDIQLDPNNLLDSSSTGPRGTSLSSAENLSSQRLPADLEASPFPSPRSNEAPNRPPHLLLEKFQEIAESARLGQFLSAPHDPTSSSGQLSSNPQNRSTDFLEGSSFTELTPVPSQSAEASPENFLEVSPGATTLSPDPHPNHSQKISTTQTLSETPKQRQEFSANRKPILPPPPEKEQPSSTREQNFLKSEAHRPSGVDLKKMDFNLSSQYNKTFSKQLEARPASEMAGLQAPSAIKKGSPFQPNIKAPASDSVAEKGNLNFSPLPEEAWKTSDERRTNVSSTSDECRTQTSDEHPTNVSPTSDKRRTQTSDEHPTNVSSTSDERRTQHRTNIGQDQEESLRLERLGTQEFAFMRFTYQLCESMGSLETPRIALRDIAEACSINGNTPEAIRKNAYKVISRVIEKNLVTKVESKDGRNGWVRFGLSRSVYHALFNITKMMGNTAPDPSKHRTERRTNVGPEGVGVNYINITPPPEGEPTEDEKLMAKAHSFDIERLAPFGFTYNNLVRILRSGKFKDKELLQESLDHIAYQLITKGVAGLKTPHVFIEKTLIRDGFYRVPGFLGFQAQAQEQYIEYMAEKRAREEEQAAQVLSMMTEIELADLDVEAELRLPPAKSEIERKSRKMILEIERKKIILDRIRKGVGWGDK